MSEQRPGRTPSVVIDDRGALPGMRRPAKKPSRIGNVATSLASVAVGLLACELLMHVFPEFQLPVSDEQYLFCGQPQARHQAHPLYGYTEIPGNTYFERFSNVDPWNFVRINAEGFRDNAPRTGQAVFVLGDSMVRGSLVQEGETFTSLLNQWRPQFSFLNYGIGGYGQPNSIRVYEDKAAGTPHKLLIQAVSLSTDIEDNAERAILTPDGVEITVEPADAPHNQPGPLLRTHFFLWKNSKLYQAVFSTAIRPFFGNKDSRRNMDNALEVTQRLLGRLAADAKANGAELLILILPGWAEMAGRDDGLQPDRQREMIDRFVAETPGTYMVDPTPALAVESADKTYGIIDKHLNPYGHYLVASAVDRWLTDTWPSTAGTMQAEIHGFVPQPQVTANCARLPDAGQ
jgi:hypothetical protein